MNQAKQTDLPKYGCHNRQPFKDSVLMPSHTRFMPIADENNFVSGTCLQEVRVYKQVPFRMSRECQYDQQRADPKCVGCKHIRD